MVALAIVFHGAMVQIIHTAQGSAIIQRMAALPSAAVLVLLHPHRDSGAERIGRVITSNAVGFMYPSISVPDMIPHCRLPGPHCSKQMSTYYKASTATANEASRMFGRSMPACCAFFGKRINGLLCGLVAVLVPSQRTLSISGGSRTNQYTCTR